MDIIRFIYILYILLLFVSALQQLWEHMLLADNNNLFGNSGSSHGNTGNGGNTGPGNTGPGNNNNAFIGGDQNEDPKAKVERLKGYSRILAKASNVQGGTYQPLHQGTAQPARVGLRVADLLNPTNTVPQPEPVLPRLDDLPKLNQLAVPNGPIPAQCTFVEVKDSILKCDSCLFQAQACLREGKTIMDLHNYCDHLNHSRANCHFCDR